MAEEIKQIGPDLSPLTPQEQELYVGAVFALAEAGEHDAAAELGELAATDPDALRAILAEVKEGGDGEPSQTFRG